MINIDYLMIVLLFIFGISYFGYLWDKPHNVSKILGTFAVLSFVLCVIIGCICLQLHDRQNTSDYYNYSMIQTKEFVKLGFRTGEYDKSFIVVYFPDGTSSEVRKTGIRVNNEDYSNVFIEGNQEYTVSWSVFYVKDYFNRENILYVDQETYNKIFQVTEIPLEG